MNKKTIGMFFIIPIFAAWKNIDWPIGYLPPRKKWNSADAVSYTHLDVYKRQGIDIALLGIGRVGNIAFNEPGSRLNSTTRLDVYKRQM